MVLLVPNGWLRSRDISKIPLHLCCDNKYPVCRFPIELFFSRDMLHFRFKRRIEQYEEI